MDMVDILSNVHPDLCTEENSQLENDLRGIDGVISVHYSAEHPHLMTLEYHPAQTDSETLLKHVGDRSVEASRIGLLYDNDQFKCPYLNSLGNGTTMAGL